MTMEQPQITPGSRWEHRRYGAIITVTKVTRGLVRYRGEISNLQPSLPRKTFLENFLPAHNNPIAGD